MRFLGTGGYTNLEEIRAFLLEIGSTNPNRPHGYAVAGKSPDAHHFRARYAYIQMTRGLRWGHAVPKSRTLCPDSESMREPRKVYFTSQTRFLGPPPNHAQHFSIHQGRLNGNLFPSCNNTIRYQEHQTRRKARETWLLADNQICTELLRSVA